MIMNMAEFDPKADLRRYLQAAREALLWKLEGLSEYDVRRPMVPTGTNLLGLVKHVASVEAGYFGTTFGRSFDEPLPWLDDDAEPNADMWATPEEPREQIIGLYHRVWAHSDATIEALALDAIGHVHQSVAEIAAFEVTADGGGGREDVGESLVVVAAHRAIASVRTASATVG
jgi:Protein of unknown function (DUF664)